jgi:hypothetical protein
MWKPSIDRMGANSYPMFAALVSKMHAVIDPV